MGMGGDSDEAHVDRVGNGLKHIGLVWVKVLAREPVS